MRPAEIGYTGDGTGVLGGFDGTPKNGSFGHLRWREWTQTRGLGSGAVWINACVPNCASGTFAPHAADVLASNPLRGVFRLLTITYSFHGKKVIDKRPLRHAAGTGWVYA